MEKREDRRSGTANSAIETPGHGIPDGSARLIEIGREGMRVRFCAPVSRGMRIDGHIQITLPLSQSVVPLFVRGMVTGVQESGGAWETAIQFDSPDVRMSAEAFA